MTALLESSESAPKLIDVSAPPLPHAPEEISERELWLLEHTTIEDTFAPEDPYAIHTVQTIELPDGTIHRRLVSEPLGTDGEPPYTIITTLGWTESIDTNLIKKYQLNLSRLLPGIRVISEATHGLDNTANHLSLREKFGLTLDELAAQKYKAWKFLYQNTPLIVVPTSFNASILARIQALNEAEDNPVQIIDQILDEPYLLTCEEGGSRVVKAISFFKHILTDAPKEIFARSSLSEIPELIKDYMGSFPHKGDIFAVGGQGLSLLECTKKAIIAAMLARGAYIIQGDKDCLVRDDINALPGVELKVVPGKGHSKGANHRNRARDVAEGILTRSGQHAAKLAIATL